MSYKICEYCRQVIRYGDDDALIDEDGNYFCDTDCAFSYYGITSVDWEEEERQDKESEQTKETRENFYGAHLAKDRIITNGKYAIVGADTTEINIDDGHFTNLDKIYSDLARMLVRAEHEFTRVPIKVSDLRIVDNSGGHIVGRKKIVYIEMVGLLFDKRYIDLCLELLGFTDEFNVYFGGTDDPVVIKKEDERFAVIMPEV